MVGVVFAIGPGLDFVVAVVVAVLVVVVVVVIAVMV